MQTVGPRMTSPHKHQDFIARTQSEVDTMATVMGAEPVKVRVPSDGFLDRPLTLEDRRRLDEILTPTMAADLVAEQDRIVQIPIVESGERMVSLERTFASKGLTAFFSSLPFHAACGEWGGKPRVFWTREQVAQKLIRAARGLGAIGLAINFEDGFRPEGVQEGLFRRRIADLILPQHPEWRWEQILAEARSKTAINPILAGHKGGASIDATLATQDGEPLPLGHAYPEGGALVALDSPYVTPEQWRSRQLFRAAMTMAGLVVYPGEDWHASYGDNLAAHGEGYVAQYGPLRDFDQQTGEIRPYDPADYHRPFFTETELRAMAFKTEGEETHAAR